MVTVNLFQPTANHGATFLASATVTDGHIEAVGPRSDLIDISRSVYSPRTTSMVSFEDDSEEWLRAFAESFRSAQVVAAIVEDTEHHELVAPEDVLNRLRSAAQTAR